MIRKVLFVTAIATTTILFMPKSVQAPGWIYPVSVPVKQISRGETPRIEHRIMRVTAYTARDESMNGSGITASGERAVEGRTIAADQSIPFGAQIYIPALNHTYIVTDRGGAMTDGRLDLFMADRKKALEFGVKCLEVYIKEP